MSSTSPSSNQAKVLLDTDGCVATITLNIPEKHNSLDAESLQQIQSHLDAIAADGAIRVLIVTGAGNKTFCAGAALDQLGSGDIDGDAFTDMTDKLAALAIPTICAFSGSAYGGGSEIGVACDFRVGFPQMRLFVPPARIGLCYPLNGIERFVSTLGLPVAKRLLLASEDFRGEELQQIGYLTHLVPHEEVMSKARWLAERMAGYGPMALAAMKQITQQVAQGTLDRQQAAQWVDACKHSQDLQEGLAAQREKRSPHFSGQ